MGLNLGADLLPGYDGDSAQLTVFDINERHVMAAAIAPSGRRTRAEHHRAAIKLHLRNMGMTMHSQLGHI